MLRLAAGVVGVVTSMVVATAPAVAESGMRYWSYWNAPMGEWTYASQGAGTTLVSDGSVEGWAFVVSSPTGDGAQAPSVSAEGLFTEVCGSTSASPGMARVALIVDPGSPSIAPSGESPFKVARTCVRVAEGSTGLDVLAQAHRIRANAGFLCGIDGYPATECAPVVDLAEFRTPSVEPEVEAATDATDDATDSSGTTLLIVGLVAALLLGIWVLVMRRVRQ